jgi:hypothetical protein
MIGSWLTTPSLTLAMRCRQPVGEHIGRVGCIVSINLDSPLETYTVEFSDGSDAEIKEALLSAFNCQ